MASFSDIGTISQESLINSDLEEIIRKEWTENVYASQIIDSIPEYVDVDNMHIAEKQLSEISEQRGVFDPTGRFPCMDKYTGYLNFELYAGGSVSSKNSWEYSHLLNKVFLDLNKVLLIQFKTSSYSDGLRVRALLVYKEADIRSIAVNRCRVHMMEISNYIDHKEEGICFCADYNWAGHVIQSSHPEASYEYDTQTKRHSVIVPLDPLQPGSETVTVPYSFTCKTSCVTGMNRNPVDIIFTLENSTGVVIGRQILSVKICSCPKRDKNREECNYKLDQEREIQENEIEKRVPQGKRKLGNDSNSAKKIKIEKLLTPPVTPDTTNDICQTQDQSLDLEQKYNQLINQIQNVLIQLQNMLEELKTFKKCCCSK